MQTRQYTNVRTEIQCSLYTDYYDQLFNAAKIGDVSALLELRNKISTNKLTHKMGSHPEGGLQSLLICVKDDEGKTPWDYVIANQHQRVLDACYEHFKNSNIANEYTKFYTAFWFNQIDIVRELITAKPDILKYTTINVQEWYMAGTQLTNDDISPSLMQAAVLLNSPGMVKLLREFNISDELKQGKRPLIYLAIDKGFKQLACTLAEDMNKAIIDHSIHPLSYSCIHGHFEILTELYEKSKTQYRADDLLIVITLLVNLQKKELASYFQQEYEKKRLKYTATSRPSIECEKYIDFYDQLFECAKRDDTKRFIQLSEMVVQENLAYSIGIFPEYLLHSMLICVRDNEGKTPWDYVTKQRNQKILDLLYKDYQRPTYDEWTQFVGTILYNQIAYAKELIIKSPTYLNRPIDITIFTPLDKPFSGKNLSPIEIAAYHNYPEMVIALRRQGASVELSNKQKWESVEPHLAEPLLDFANRNGFNEVADALQKDLFLSEGSNIYHSTNQYSPLLFTWSEVRGEASQPEPEQPICSII